jgi:hypothetical protein
MTARARYSVPSESVTTLMSSSSRTDSTSSVMISVPNRSACARMFSMRSGPMMPSRNPGKFSTSVVFIRAPPAVTAPSNISGSRLARAA